MRVAGRSAIQPETSTYRGRFAPSPTGPLHFGSLVAAVASYLQARAHQGEWLVRIEDIDPPREVAGASEAILTSLDAHGFEYSAPLYQSTRLAAYEELIQQLLDSGQAYPCACARKELELIARRGPTGMIYPGICRHGVGNTDRPAVAVRVYTTDEELSFTDGLQGIRRCQLETETGDFLVRRGDGLVAYQLAVMADDQAQGITEVVRGVDLLEATFMQLHLQKCLRYRELKYLHFPVVTDPNGSKLSKQNGALGINNAIAANNLFLALYSLHQSPPESLKAAPIKDIWAWADENWRLSALSGLQTLSDESMMMR